MFSFFNKKTNGTADDSRGIDYVALSDEQTPVGQRSASRERDSWFSQISDFWSEVQVASSKKPQKPDHGLQEKLLG